MKATDRVQQATAAANNSKAAAPGPDRNLGGLVLRSKAKPAPLALNHHQPGI
jgi:hypothetical protein